MTAREKKVYSYMVALARLYGIVPWRQFIKVFNRYNTPKITKKEILDTPAYWRKSEIYCSLYTNALVYSRVDGELIAKAQSQAIGKEYYMPTEEEVLALSKPKEYIEQSEAHMILYDTIKGILSKNPPKKNMSVEEMHKMMCVTLGTMISAGEKQQIIFDVIGGFGVSMLDMDDAQDFVDKLRNAWNNTRMWANCGFTPNESVAKMPKEPENEELFIVQHKGKHSDTSNDFAVQFYKVWYKLTYWINQKYKIVPTFPPPFYGRRVNEIPIIKIRNNLWENPEYITEYLESDEAKTINSSERQTLADWHGKFIKGRFLIHKHLSGYSVFQAFEREKDKRLYAVCGITNSIEDALSGNETPVLVDAVLLPFNGKIVYDTFLVPYSLDFQSNVKMAFADFYKEAEAEYGIITTIK